MSLGVGLLSCIDCSLSWMLWYSFPGLPSIMTGGCGRKDVGHSSQPQNWALVVVSGVQWGQGHRGAGPQATDLGSQETGVKVGRRTDP